MDTHNIIYGVDTSVHNPQPHSLSHRQRTGHVFVCGTSADYKNALLWNMITQDIEAGAGVCVLDGGGAFAKQLLDAVPPRRLTHTHFFNPLDPQYCVGFNPFRGVPKNERSKTAQEIMELFRNIWNLDYERTPLLLDFLRSSTRVMLDCPHGSFLALQRFFSDETYRKWVVSHCDDVIARPFWTDYDGWKERDKRDRIQPVLTRLRTFFADDNLRSILGQVRAPLSIETVVNSGQIFLADLNRTSMGFEASKLIGCLLGTRFRTALQSTKSTKPIYLYIPNCDQFSAGLFASLFDGSLNRQVSVNLSTQQISGFDATTRNNLLSAQTLIAFRLSPDDAHYLYPQFDLPQPEESLANLQPYNLACNQHRHELAAIKKHSPAYNRGAEIQRRSQHALCVKRSKIQRKIQSFLLNSSELREI